MSGAMTQFQHQHAPLNGLDYHFVTAGEGPPVLLLHGFPDLWLGWRGLCTSWSQRAIR
jgi:pimeloyl-ACP methyl ester carboxylesterase